MRTRVLVADDSGVVRAVLTEQLSARGFTVLQAADGEQALTVCRRERPDIVLLDVDMPVRTGHEVLTELRGAAETRDIPVVFLTGRAQVSDAAEGLALGAHDYLRKPVEPIELVARMTTALRLSELQDELRRRNDELSESVGRLEEANAELTNANKLAADLIAMLSHDLRQPLTTIIAYAEVLVTDWSGVPDSDKHQSLERMHAAARHLDQLVEEVLIMVRAETDAMPTERREIVAAAAVHEALTVLAVAPDAVTVRDPASARALVDPGHLKHILSNLLGNALKYGAPPVEVEVGHAAGAVEIRISDHGEGVPAEFVPRVFDRFARAGSGVATTKKGTGLGLYIVRQLAHANRATVRYERNEPAGASFILRLEAPPDGAAA
ncbi:MAG TPA: response regulator [Pilimelia sp.]|nr:response regulator [Pilimelia sp.]